MSNQKVFLLNTSNMEAFPVFPYAFIQVPAVARQVGIEVLCKDLLGVAQGMWEQTIQGLIEEHNPAMILITLRNTDSLNAQDYERRGSMGNDGRAYFPIEKTRDLIATIREVSELKISVGGFGFSVMPDELMHYLRPDFGVFGDPDSFFKHFEDILAGNLKDVPNLLYFQDDQLISNARVFYPPLAKTEYTQQVIEEMMAFYDAFPSPGFQGAPVEVMRGCRYSCIFCSEPLVKGRQVRYRDLSAVMGDIEILVDHGITRLYILSSELNPEGNAFALELADRIYTFNQQQPEDQKVTWFGANYLLNFSSQEFERLYKSGFTGGWFDISALDDENACAMQTPYKNKPLLTYLKKYAHFRRKQATQTKKETSAEDDAIGWTMFLGNPATTVETIRNTLRTANQNRIAELFDNCGIIAPIRVFDYEKPDQPTLDVTYSVTTDLERTSYQQIMPSFAFPPALLQVFGSEEEISTMFKYIAETFLSTKYQKSRDWNNFFKQNTSATALERWMTEMSSAYGIDIPDFIILPNTVNLSPILQDLFAEDEPNDEKLGTYENLIKRVTDSLLSICLKTFPDLLGEVGLPNTMAEFGRMKPYDLAAAIYNRYSTEQELIDALNESLKTVQRKPIHGYIRFCVKLVLYKLNVIIHPRYRSLFI